jgi:hypothetical protein
MSTKAVTGKRPGGGGAKRTDGKKGKQQGKKDGETGKRSHGASLHGELQRELHCFCSSLGGKFSFHLSETGTVKSSII